MASLSRDEDVAGGFDAPRNSLDETSSIETTKSVKPKDIPFGYEVCNPACDEKRRAGPNVVARLMGLDTMPDDRHNSLPKMPRGKLRKTHPQEAELQKFKKEFEANNTNRQLEEKKRKVRAMLDKARLALSQGKKFEDSKEFLEAMEFLQCNKDFIFQFLQEKPHAVFSLNATGTPVKQQQQKTTTTTSPRKQSTERSRREPGFNPRALARLFMPSDPCKGNDHNKQKSTSTTSRYMLPASPRVQNDKPSNKSGARDIIVEIKERLRRREQEQVQHTKALRKHENNFKDESQKTSNFTLTKSLSTGKRISMMRPEDMSDGEEISTPKTLQITESSPAAETTKKKTSLASRSSPRSSTEKCVKPMRKLENATVNSSSPRLSHSSVNDSNLTRCRSVPNVALLREQCTTGAPKNTSPKVAKPAQNGAHRKLGLFSVGRKKAIPAAEPSNAGSKNGKDSNLRETKVRRNILDGQDATSDRNGLLSPVSVWERPESLQFKDITKDLQDPLRVRLQRPQLDGRSTRVKDNEFDHTTRERQRAEAPHQSPSRTSSNQINAERRPGTKTDFAFVRDILVASGFHLHGGRNITRWHSATQPISHRLLLKVESTGAFRRSSSSLHWRSLFDAINEVLIAKLDQSSPAQCYGLPLVGAPSSAASGRRFVEDVWSEIHKRQFTSCQENFLHSLVAQDLQTTSSWLLLRKDVDRICLQVEKAIWNDLVEEFVLSSVH